jgi:Protein of unknown function (DUF2789)
MNPPFHRFTELFAQLGLPNDGDSIARFVNTHRLPAQVPLCDAPFWTPAQATLLREEWQEDGDWAEVVDRLDAALRD